MVEKDEYEQQQVKDDDGCCSLPSSSLLYWDRIHAPLNPCSVECIREPILHHFHNDDDDDKGVMVWPTIISCYELVDIPVPVQVSTSKKNDEKNDNKNDKKYCSDNDDDNKIDVTTLDNNHDHNKNKIDDHHDRIGDNDVDKDNDNENNKDVTTNDDNDHSLDDDNSVDDDERKEEQQNQPGQQPLKKKQQQQYRTGQMELHLITSSSSSCYNNTCVSGDEPTIDNRLRFDTHPCTVVHPNDELNHNILNDNDDIDHNDPCVGEQHNHSMIVRGGILDGEWKQLCSTTIRPFDETMMTTATTTTTTTNSNPENNNNETISLSSSSSTQPPIQCFASAHSNGSIYMHAFLEKEYHRRDDNSHDDTNNRNGDPPSLNNNLHEHYEMKLIGKSVSSSSSSSPSSEQQNQQQELCDDNDDDNNSNNNSIVDDDSSCMRKPKKNPLCLSVTWDNNNQQQHQQQHDPYRIVSTYSNGTIAIHDVVLFVTSPEEENENEKEEKADGNNKSNNNSSFTSSTSNNVSINITESCRWLGHELYSTNQPAEVWTACFLHLHTPTPPSSCSSSNSSSYTNHSIICSGGDEGLLKLWDTRIVPQPIQTIVVNDTLRMGITCLAPHPIYTTMVAVGSYDEMIRLYDMRYVSPSNTSTRKAKPILVHETDSLGGGIWRMKWHSHKPDRMLIAAMHGGAFVYDFQNLSSSSYYGNDRLSNEFTIQTGSNNSSSVTSHCIKSFTEHHQSMVYGADWIIHQDQTGRTMNIDLEAAISCSFYDRTVYMWDATESTYPHAIKYVDVEEPKSSLVCIQHGQDLSSSKGSNHESYALEQ